MVMCKCEIKEKRKKERETTLGHGKQKGQSRREQKRDFAIVVFIVIYTSRLYLHSYKESRSNQRRSVQNRFKKSIRAHSVDNSVKH